MKELQVAGKLPLYDTAMVRDAVSVHGANYAYRALRETAPEQRGKGGAR